MRHFEKKNLHEQTHNKYELKLVHNNSLVESLFRFECLLENAKKVKKLYWKKAFTEWTKGLMCHLIAVAQLIS